MNTQENVTPKEIDELKTNEKILYSIIMFTTLVIVFIISYALNWKIKPVAGGLTSTAIGMPLAWVINSIIKSNKFREFNNKAINFVKVGENEKAIYQFELAVCLRPNNPALHYNLAWLYSLVENKEKSLTHLNNSQKFGLENLKSKIEKNSNFNYIKKFPEFIEFFNSIN